MGEVNLTLPTSSPGSDGADGRGYGGTSTTSLLIGTGSKVFTTQSTTVLAYQVGSRVRAASAADTTKWMEGVITAYSGTSMTINVDDTNGAGTFSDWNLSIAGETGTAGAAGAPGADGADGADGVGYALTSTSSVLIETGSKTFTTAENANTTAYVAGQRIRAINSASNWMEGTITSFTGTTLVINVTDIEGSGTFNTWTFGIAGEFGEDGATYAQEYANFTLDSNNTFTGGTSVRIQRANPAGVTTSASRTITLTPGTGDNYFSVIFPVQFTIGTGFTYTITQGGGSDLVKLKEGTHPPRRYDFHYTGTTYVAHEYPISMPSGTVQDNVTQQRYIVAEYDFATDGGGLGTHTLSEVLPAGAIIDVDNIIIETITPLTSGGSAVLSIGHASSLEAFDYSRPYTAYPYNSANQTSKIYSYGSSTGSTSTTINKRSGRWTTAALATAAGASTTATLTNSFIDSTSQVLVTMGNYSGTLTTNGIPVIYVTEGSGSADVVIHNAHAANALNGTLTLKFEVINPKVAQQVIKLTSPSAVVVVIATAALTGGKFNIYIPYTLNE